MGLVNIFLVQILIAICPQLYAIDQNFQLKLDGISSYDFQATPGQVTQPIIQINLHNNRLIFTPIQPNALQHEYPIGTIIQIITSSELSKRLVLQDKLSHSIPLTNSHFDVAIFTDSAHNNHYQIQLQHAGDYCFVQLPLGLTHVPFNEHNYCFRVLPIDILTMSQRVIYIPDATTLSLSELKAAIQEKLHIISADQSTDSAVREQLSKRRMLPRHPMIIGIVVTFETNGILIPEVSWGKLLFLIQHIVDKFMRFASSDDLIITLPVAKKLNKYQRATVSERVALIVNNAKRKHTHLQLAYELQYSRNTEFTFGGRIVLGVSANQPPLTTNVPVNQMQIADYVIEIAGDPNNQHAYQISVQQPANSDRICFSEIKALGYDYLFTVSNIISKCVLNAMNIPNGLTIDISDEESDIHTNTAKEDILIEFELELEGNECCFIQLSQKSMYDQLYANHVADDNNRQIVAVKANKIAVIPSKSVLESKTIHIHDIVYKVDTVDEFNKYEFVGGMDISSHSKIQSCHNLLYSSKEYILIPDDLWYLCVSWTQTIDVNDGANSKQIQTTKCSDDLYFTVNFLMHPNDINLANGLNTQSVYQIDKLDTSGFLSLQLVHLQSLLQRIIDLRSQMNEGNQDAETVYHDLQVHKALSSRYKQHLNQIEIMYQNHFNKIGENNAERQELQRQLKIIQQQLRDNEAFEKQYADGLHRFLKSEMTDPQKMRTELMDHIRNSQEQIVRLQISIRQQKDMLHSLKEQIDSIEINVN